MDESGGRQIDPDKVETVRERNAEIEKDNGEKWLRIASLEQKVQRIHDVAEAGMIRGAAFALGEIQRICEEKR